MRPFLIFTLAIASVVAFSQEKAAPKILLPEGLVAEIVAAPPLVEHPIMAAFDDLGRLFVSENAGLNLNKAGLEEQKPSSVRLLTDTNGDGIFDESTVFADGLTFPQGALWLMDSLYVMSPPSLWRFEDTDDDGVADVREELVTGFDYTGNAADVHGPFLHPNGRLYWCHGRKGHDVTDESTGEVVSQAKGARIWSCRPDGSDLRVFAGGGMDNPVEVDFTETGEIFGSVNLFYGRPRGDVLVHWIRGGVYPRYDQEAVIDEFLRTGPLLTEFHNFGHVAISGMLRYRSGHLNPAWKDTAIATHFNTQQVTTTKFGVDGSTFSGGETETIFKIMNPDAHITDVVEDANGDLLVLDTGGWFRIGCPSSQVAKPDIAGAIYRIRKADDNDSEIDFRGVEIDWENRDPDKIAALLDSEHFAIRDRAITEMASRGQSAIPELQTILANPNSTRTAKQNAVWTLSRLRFSEAVDLIFASLADSDSTVVQAACNAIAATRSWQVIRENDPNEAAIEFERNDAMGQALAKLVLSGEPPVARAAASALGVMADPNAVGSLLRAAGRKKIDRYLQHAAILSLTEIGDPEATRIGLESGNEGQAIAALWALDQMENGDLEPLDVINLLDSNKDVLRSVAIEIATGHPEWDAAIANRFFEWETANEVQQATMEAMIPEQIHLKPMQDVVTSLIHFDNTLENNRIGYQAIANSKQDYPFPNVWIESFEADLHATHPKKINEVLDALARMRPDPLPEVFEAQLTAISENEANPVPKRVRALRVLSGKEGLVSKNAFDLLVGLIVAGTSPLQRLDASQMLAGSRLTKAQQLEIAKRVQHAGPLDLPVLWKILDRTRDPETGKVLAANISKSSGFGNLNPAELRRTFGRFDSETLKTIEPQIVELEKRAAERSERLAALVPLVEKGDPERGKAHFLAGKGACITCHQIGEAGRAIGPDLSTIGRIRTHRDLLESILYPSESLARDFETYNVTLKDGTALMGLIKRETTDFVYLTDVTGTEKPLSRGDVKTITPIAMSIMPQGLEQAMSQEELLDLTSYLKSIQ